jgi:hypothetical protein
VRITSGYALDPYGNEVVVPTPIVVDLCKEDITGGLACLPYDDPWCRPIETSRTGTHFLAVRFREQAGKPIHAPTGCSCKDASCQNSRYRDDYEFKLLPELPDHYTPPCGPLVPCAGIDECPVCPSSGWIVLATVTMTLTAIDTMTDENRRHVQSLAGACLDCTKAQPDLRSYTKFEASKRLIGISTTTPDALVKVRAVVDGLLTEIEIPVAGSDLRGKTASDVATAWASVPLFDTDDPSLPPFNADWLFAHSPMKGSWVIESADDLSARLGNPVINTSYSERRKTLEALLDDRGRRHFHEELLDNVHRLNELSTDMLTGVSARTAAGLRPIGIDSVADLATADVENPLVAAAMRPRLIAVRNALGRGQPHDVPTRRAT